MMAGQAEVGGSPRKENRPKFSEGKFKSEEKSRMAKSEAKKLDNEEQIRASRNGRGFCLK